MSADQQYQMWKQQALSDNSDWMLCERCYHVAERYSKKAGSGSSCFVATAVYQSPNAPEVMILRQFRDEVLSSYTVGKAFIVSYYKVGPYLASVIQRCPILRSLVKIGILQPMIQMITQKRSSHM